jgi:hypothetical protein
VPRLFSKTLSKSISSKPSTQNQSNSAGPPKLFRCSRRSAHQSKPPKQYSAPAHFHAGTFPINASDFLLIWIADPRTFVDPNLQVKSLGPGWRPALIARDILSSRARSKMISRFGYAAPTTGPTKRQPQQHNRSFSKSKPAPRSHRGRSANEDA